MLRTSAKSLFVVLALLVLCAGGPRRDADKPEDAHRIKLQATETVEAILDGLSKGDFGLYTSRFSDILKNAFTREDFLRLQNLFQKRLGRPESAEYLGHYFQSKTTITLFKARFAKDSDDVLIKLVLEEKSAPPLVVGLWFDSPRLVK